MTLKLSSREILSSKWALALKLNEYVHNCNIFTTCLWVPFTTRGPPEALIAPPAFRHEKIIQPQPLHWWKWFTIWHYRLLPCHRCHLGDPERGSGRPPGCHAAALLLPGRVQHPAAPSSGRRLQPLRLAREEQMPQQQWPSQRRSARWERTFTTQLCGSSSKSTRQSINSLLQPGEAFLRVNIVLSYRSLLTLSLPFVINPLSWNSGYCFRFKNTAVTTVSFRATWFDTSLGTKLLDI